MPSMRARPAPFDYTFNSRLAPGTPMDRSLKIHVVDDDPQIRDTVKQALEMTGHVVRTSPAGDVGLDDMLSSPPTWRSST